MTYAELAEETGIAEPTIRQTVTRKASSENPLFTITKGADGVQRIGLATRRV
jgi:LPS O-antigen subunit length determinant protein (WzzB/FepE family)